MPGKEGEMFASARLRTKDSRLSTSDATAPPRSCRRQALVALPVMGTTILPQVVCPACCCGQTMQQVR
jgi:hypothetical protein